MQRSGSWQRLLAAPAAVVLALGSPLQRLANRHRRTHAFLTDQALAILGRDGFRAEARWLQGFRRSLVAGLYWADEDWRNSTHLYDPETGRGLPFRPHALETCNQLWGRALRLLRRREWEPAVFFLGAAVHLVQDLCVPHHAAARLFSGHSAFEDLAESRCLRHGVERGGLYDLGQEEPGEWLVANARYARPYLPLVCAPTQRPDDAELALADLLPRAQRSTAGVLLAALAAAGRRPAQETLPLTPQLGLAGD